MLSNKKKLNNFISSLIYICMLITLNLEAKEIALTMEGVVTVDADQAHRLHSEGAIFLDIRRQNDWQLGHIKEAVHLDFFSNFIDLKNSDRFKPQSPIVIYGNSTESVDAAYAATVAVNWGFRQVYYLREGYFSWLVKDYPSVLKINNN